MKVAKKTQIFKYKYQVKIIKTSILIEIQIIYKIMEVKVNKIILNQILKQV